MDNHGLSFPATCRHQGGQLISKAGIRRAILIRIRKELPRSNLEALRERAEDFVEGANGTVLVPLGQTRRYREQDPSLEEAVRYRSGKGFLRTGLPPLMANSSRFTSALLTKRR